MSGERGDGGELVLEGSGLRGRDSGGGGSGRDRGDFGGGAERAEIFHLRRVIGTFSLLMCCVFRR